jgi:hypothetical protein
MLDEGFISHASGSVLQPFVDGFYLYYIVGTADRKSGELGKMDYSGEPLHRFRYGCNQDECSGNWIDSGLDFSLFERTLYQDLFLRIS